MKTNITTKFKRKSLLLSVIAAMSAMPLQFAQAADEDELEEITVTGSRIRQTSGMVTPVPITAVTMSELTSYEPDSTISEQLDQLPQFFQTSSAQRGGVITGSSGGSFLNMRGIGSNRTLILLDGSRVVPNDRTGVVNVDVFPTALIRNIEVVTGGASAAYGADALAGVVNFVLDREFEGLKTSVSTGITEQHDGQNWNASVAGGRQFGDRLHLIGSLEGRRIHQIDRDMSAASGQWDSFRRWGHVTNPAWQAASQLPAGDPNRCVATIPCAAGPQRLTLPDVHSTVSTPTGLISAPAAGTTPASVLNRMTFLEDGSGYRPFVNGDVFLPNPTTGLQSQSGGPEALLADLSFNVGPFGNEVQQEALFTGFKFDATDRFNIHGDVIISNTESNTHDQPGIPHLQGGQANWQATLYSGNPFLPANVQQIMTAENRPFIRVDKLGQPMGIADWDSYESQHNQFSTWTANAGFDFDLNGNWQLSGYYQSGETDRTTIIYNEVRIDRLFMAIDAVRDANGAIVCNVQKVNPTPEQLQAAVAGKVFNAQQTSPITRTSPVGGDNAIRDCVPLNILGVGQSSQAARDYVHDDRIAHTNVQQDFAELVLDGELFEGFGAGPVSLAAGLTWRDSSFKQYFETTSGDPLDGPPVNAENLGIRGIPNGYLVSSSMFMFGGVPNISGDYDVWEIFSEVNIPVWESASGNQRLEFNFAGRNSDYSRSGEIVSWKAGTSFQVTEDLRLRGTLSRDVREPSFAELFDQQGTAAAITDNFFNPPKSQQLTIVNGGNPDLKPEEADTTTIGLVYQPTFGNWLDGFQVSLDWYEIDIEGLIASLGAQRLVDDCLKGSALACSYVERHETTNDVLRVENIFLNINAATVSGVDAEIVYRMEPDFFSSEAENFSVRALIGYMAENSQTNLGAPKLEQAGGPGRPEWSSTVSATYGLGAFDATLRANYFDSVLVNNMWVEGVDVDDNVTASSTVWNLGLGYNGETSAGSTWRASFNVTNLFDREPPIIASFSTRFGSQTVSNDYDVFGRRYQLSFNYDF